MSKQWFKRGTFCPRLKVTVGERFCLKCIYSIGSVAIGEDLMFGCCHPSLRYQKPPVEVPTVSAPITGLSILGDVEV